MPRNDASVIGPVASLLNTVGLDMKPIRVGIDYPNRLLTTLAGPVARTVPVFIELPFITQRSQVGIDQVLTALEWGYAVQALPRVGGPHERGKADGRLFT